MVVVTLIVANGGIVKVSRGECHCCHTWGVTTSSYCSIGGGDNNGWMIINNDEMIGRVKIFFPYFYYFIIYIYI